jgi:CsoR family transcriptional regulator, copper-sensing transcriptional repressor
MYGYYENKDELLTRLRRIEGQVRGIHRMVEGDEYCIDILTQVSAAGKALKKVAVALLEDHIRSCLKEGRPERGGREAMVTEASSAIDRLVSS